MFEKFCPPWARILSAILILLIFVGVVVWLGVAITSKIKAYSYIGAPEAMRDTITISGEGRVTAIPDIATISIGVTTEKKEVADAQKENTEKINKIVRELKELEIDDKDIKTSSYNIYPKYDYSEGGGRLVGYVVDQQLTIKIRNLEIVGKILGKVAELGANQIGGLQFTIDDQETLKQEAREKALANARGKAEALAKISGVKLGKIVSFSESSDGYEPYPYYARAEAAYGFGGGESAAPNIQTGSLDIMVYATVSYEIK